MGTPPLAKLSDWFQNAKKIPGKLRLRKEFLCQNIEKEIKKDKTGNAIGIGSLEIRKDTVKVVNSKQVLPVLEKGITPKIELALKNDWSGLKVSNEPKVGTIRSYQIWSRI